MIPRFLFARLLLPLLLPLLLLVATHPLRAQSLFSEDFESVVLGDPIDEAFAEMVWAKTPPAGWTIDDSKMPGLDDDSQGVKEWEGWSFANKEWWVQVAEDQDRSTWISGRNTVAIADPDEWDDKGDPEALGTYETSLITPSIGLQNAAPNSVLLAFDSSWNPEFDTSNQSAKLTVSYDGGQPLEIFRWVSDPSSPDFKPEAIDEKVVVPLNNPEGAASMVLSFTMFDAGNDWWWAIDNIEISAGTPVVSRLVARRSLLHIELTDTGVSKIDQQTVVLTVDGEAVEAGVSKENGIVRIVYEPAPPFPPDSEHSYLITADDESGAPLSFEGIFEVPKPALPNDPLPGPGGEDGAFGVRYVWGTGTSLASLELAVAAVETAATVEFAGGIFDTVHPFINHGDGLGFFPNDEPYPDEVLADPLGLWTDEDFVQFAKGTIRVASGGDFTFGIHTDDGFAFRIFGAEFTSATGNGRIDPGAGNTVIHPSTTGDSSTRAVVALAAGDYDIEFLWYERGGGDYGELYVARGTFAGDGDTADWELVGDPAVSDPVLRLVGSPLVLPVVQNISLDAGSVAVDFTTPDSSADHALQRSLTLLPASWIIDDAAEMVELGQGLFRFSTGREPGPLALYRVAVLEAPPVFFDDFESGSPGWTVDTASGDTHWELGAPAEPGPAAAFSGANVWGTDLDGNYGPGSVTSLRSPVIDLTGLSRPRLRFHYFIDSTPDLEGGQLRFLDEAGGVLFTRDEVFSGSTSEWTELNIVLPREVQDQKISLEFRLLTDGDNAVGTGWYIDDVMVDR